MKMFEISTPAPPFQLSNPPPKPIKPPPRKREPRQEKLTPRERKVVHDAEVVQGYNLPGRCAESEPLHEDEAWFRHHNWKGKRSLVIAALGRSGTGTRQMDAFQNCGSECVVEWCEEQQRYRLRASYCHSRHCEPCMKAKANLLAANLRDRLDERTECVHRFITLTLRHTPADSLVDLVRKLNVSFKKLRNHPCWKSSQRGGCSMLEIKWSQYSGWHPHLHIISEGTWIHWKDLRRAWFDITGGSTNVDIKILKTHKDVAYYVAKYVSKGTNNEVWEDEQAAIEYVVATKGVRTCATYGSWRGFALLKKPKQEGTWIAIDLLRTIARKAREGSEHHRNLLEILRDSFQYDPGKKRSKAVDPPIPNAL